MPRFAYPGPFGSSLDTRTYHFDGLFQVDRAVFCELHSVLGNSSDTVSLTAATSDTACGVTISMKSLEGVAYADSSLRIV
jgi:hypothetical protein